MDSREYRRTLDNVLAGEATAEECAVVSDAVTRRIKEEAESRRPPPANGWPGDYRHEAGLARAVARSLRNLTKRNEKRWKREGRG